MLVNEQTKLLVVSIQESNIANSYIFIIVKTSIDMIVYDALKLNVVIVVAARARLE